MPSEMVSPRPVIHVHVNTGAKLDSKLVPNFTLSHLKANTIRIESIGFQILTNVSIMNVSTMVHASTAWRAIRAPVPQDLLVTGVKSVSNNNVPLRGLYFAKLKCTYSGMSIYDFV